MVLSGRISTWSEDVYNLYVPDAPNASLSAWPKIKHQSTTASATSSSRSTSPSVGDASESSLDSPVEEYIESFKYLEPNVVKLHNCWKPEEYIIGVGTIFGNSRCLHNPDPNTCHLRCTNLSCYNVPRASPAIGLTTPLPLGCVTGLVNRPGVGPSHQGSTEGRVTKAKGRSKGKSKDVLNNPVVRQILGEPSTASNNEGQEEFPDFFFWFDNLKYAIYKWRCSRGQRHYDFFKRSLIYHYEAGHFHEEFGSEEAALAAFWRAMDASPGMHDTRRSSKDYRQLHYQLKLQALWCIPVNEAPIRCRDAGTHPEYTVKLRHLLYDKPLQRPAQLSGIDDRTTTQPQNIATSSVQSEWPTEDATLIQSTLSSTVAVTPSDPKADGFNQPGIPAQVLENILSEMKAMRQDQQTDRQELKSLRFFVERGHQHTQSLLGIHLGQDDTMYTDLGLIDQNGDSFEMFTTNSHNHPS